MLLLFGTVVVAGPEGVARFIGHAGTIVLIAMVGLFAVIAKTLR